MRWWHVGLLAALVLFYSTVIGWKEHEVDRVNADRDRLLGELADFRIANSKLHTALGAAEVRVRELDGAPVRGPYPDGMSDERLDPWRPGTRQVSEFSFAVPGSGVCAVTVDPPVCAAGPLVPGLPSPPTDGGHNVKDIFVFTPPPIPGNETVAIGPLAPATQGVLPPASPKVRAYTGMLLERKDYGGDPAFVLVTRDADYWLVQDPRRTPLADLRALVGREVRVKSAGQVTVGTRRFLTAAEVKPAGEGGR